MAEEAKEDEGGICSSIKDGFVALFMGIFYVLEFIFNIFYYTFYYIVKSFEFIWYPIKEKCGKCCQWCSNKQSRSQDPAYSTFDNEI